MNKAKNEQSTTKLSPKRSRALAQEVMNDLAAKIRNGLYRPGEKLPTEPEIMAEQGVTRGVARKAVSRLQAAGFVEKRHGLGAFVLSPPAPPLPLRDGTTVVTIRDVRSILELRMGLETEAAGLAALRRTDEHLALMRQAVDAFETAINNGQSSVDADFQFHLLIALATGNKYFEDFYRYLGTATIPRAHLEAVQISPGPGQSYLYRVNREHAHILAAITSKDPEIARAGMRDHLAEGCERLRRAIEAADQPAGMMSAATGAESALRQGEEPDDFTTYIPG